MKSVLIKLTSVIFVFAVLTSAWLLMTYQQLKTTTINVEKSGLHYEIKPGETLKQLTSNLSSQGVISHPQYLVWYARLKGIASSIKQGEYLFKQDISALDLLDQIVTGKTVQYSITIVEGWTFAEMLSYLNKNVQLEHTLKGLSGKQIMNKLGYPDQHPEGRFLPDTYHFPRGMTDLAFLQRAYRNLEKTLNQEWELRQVELPYKTPYEGLIMASIVEKETGLASERPEIAGVFVRRLIKRMRLQTDPTVIYGMGEKFDGNLRRRDLQRDTPYNTYRRHGLPPTPIALAGKDAIHAAFNPDAGESLYFVAKGDGSHKFTSNLKDHNNAVIKYQLGGKPKPFSSMKKVNKSN